ncbi:maleylacetoacetate isomerase [Ranunculus cassubicifolius]
MAEAGSPKLKLYSFFISSCSWRVRIALNLKGLKYEYKAVNLLKGEQFSEEYKKVNPIGYVPALVDDDIVIADSLAILLYMEEKYPQYALLPKDLQKKAVNLQVANIVGSSIQPHQLAGQKSIAKNMSADEKLVYIQYYTGQGFAAIEKLLKDHVGKYVKNSIIVLY